MHKCIFGIETRPRFQPLERGGRKILALSPARRRGLAFRFLRNAFFTARLGGRAHELVAAFARLSNQNLALRSDYFLDWPQIIILQLVRYIIALMPHHLWKKGSRRNTTSKVILVILSIIFQRLTRVMLSIIGQF
jgi:hypothetical protein